MVPQSNQLHPSDFVRVSEPTPWVVKEVPTSPNFDWLFFAFPLKRVASAPPAEPHEIPEVDGVVLMGGCALNVQANQFIADSLGMEAPLFARAMRFNEDPVFIS